MNNVGDLQVWWVPQAPGDPFTVDVKNVEEGVWLMNILADYDSFRHDHNIANDGGLVRWSDRTPYDGNPGWQNWYDEETMEIDPKEYLKNLCL